MPKISEITLQKRYGGKWIALSKGEGKVYAAKARFDQLIVTLKKKKIDTKKVVFTKVEKLGTLSVYKVSLSV
jgi:hypothetical protein